ncbi:MAG: efflux RND transporter periplasmic adaptor subunit [Candidatus Acidiferrales bacterium]
MPWGIADEEYHAGDSKLEKEVPIADINETSSARPDYQLTPPDPGSDHPRSHKVLWVVITVVLLLVIVLVIVMAVHSHEEAKKAVAATAARAKTGIAITTATAQKGDIGVYLEAIGTVTPVYTDSITAQVNGLVTTVHFVEGQMVKKGDPLIEIDPRPYSATLLQAQGALERDQNLLAQAQMDEQRYQDAWDRKAIAKQQLDDQQKLVLQDEGIVKNDEGTVQYDQVQLDFCHITAPISGRMGLRLVDPGNVVQSSGTITLAVITQMAPITVIFTIPEDSLGQVQAGMRKNGSLSTDAFDRSAQKKIGSGKLLTLDNQIDTTTGTVKARAVFDNKNNALFPNQFVNTRLLVDTLKGVTLIPASAVQQNGQASFVYVIQNNVAHQRSVKAGVTNAGNTQVDGISPGDIVANSGFEKLQDNSAVVVSNNPAPANSSGGKTPASTNGSSAP